MKETEYYMNRTIKGRPIKSNEDQIGPNGTIEQYMGRTAKGRPLKK